MNIMYSFYSLEKYKLIDNNTLYLVIDYLGYSVPFKCLGHVSEGCFYIDTFSVLDCSIDFEIFDDKDFKAFLDNLVITL